MSQEQQVWVAILATAVSLFSFIAGKIYEQRHQSLAIKAKMLIPIEEWIEGIEKIVLVLADTVAVSTTGNLLLLTYGIDDRQQIARLITEKTNRVLGIIKSNSLRTWQTRNLLEQLSSRILALDSQIKYVLLPLDLQIFNSIPEGSVTKESIIDALALKDHLDTQIQEVHSLIAKIKTAYA